MADNNPFSADNVMTVSVQGLREAQANLERINNGLKPESLRAKLGMAAGMVHRHVMSLGQDHPPTKQKGVLPVWSGRLKGSIFWDVETIGGEVTARVASNLIYAGVAEDRHGFMSQTKKDMTEPVLELLEGYVSELTGVRTYVTGETSSIE